jgi:hypothetical protein
MFIDRLLDNWGKFDFQGSLIRSKAYPSDLPDGFLKKCMAESIPFNIQNVFDYFVNIRKNITINSFPNVKAVYTDTWFEFSVINQPDRDILKTVGVFVTEGIDTNGEFISSAVTFNEFDDKSFAIAKMSFHSRYDEKGQLINSWFSPANHTEGWGRHIALSNMVVWLAISFMHCKNVTIQSTKTSLKLQKARERRGKLPLFTFKTLEIKPMTKILKEEGESETQGLARALHICRGHFKDFQQGPGLGKNHAHGLYWWDSQVRGNREVGAVIKDYKVSP